MSTAVTFAGWLLVFGIIFTVGGFFAICLGMAAARGDRRAAQSRQIEEDTYWDVDLRKRQERHERALRRHNGGTA